MKPQLKGSEVFVSHISTTATEEDLRTLFAVCGTVRAVKMMGDANGAFYGRAFIRMGSPAEARDAIVTLDGARFLNSCIRVSVPEKKTAAEPVPARTGQKPGQRKPPGGRRR